MPYLHYCRTKKTEVYNVTVYKVDITDIGMFYQEGGHLALMVEMPLGMLTFHVGMPRFKPWLHSDSALLLKYLLGGSECWTQSGDLD